eukprot:14594643-Alexandrium_andersonii.AAC.1
MKHTHATRTAPGAAHARANRAASNRATTIPSMAMSAASTLSWPILPKMARVLRALSPPPPVTPVT